MTLRGSPRSPALRDATQYLALRAGARLARQPSRLTWSLVILVVSNHAQAHSLTTTSSGLLAGLSHPVSGLDHFVAMVSVGLWGAQLGRPAIWLLPLTFPLVMAVGGFMGLVGVALPNPQIGIALSAMLLGTMVLFAARPPMAVAAGMVSLFAIFHGYAHGTELPPSADALSFSLGFIVATGALHLLGVGIGMINRWQWGRVTLRSAGALVLGTGTVFLCRTVA